MSVSPRPSGRLFRRLLVLSALCLCPACDRPNKARVCAEYDSVMSSQPYPTVVQPGDYSYMNEVAANFRKAAQILEGLEGTPEADAHRAALLRMADLDEQMSQRIASGDIRPDPIFGPAYTKAAAELKTTGFAFTKSCR